MHRVLSIATAGLAAGFALGAADGTGTPHEARWAVVDTAGELPADLVEPEGKARWSLAAVPVAGFEVREIRPDADGSLEVVRRLTADSGPLGRSRWLDAAGLDAAARWLLPQIGADALRRPGKQPLELRRETGEGGATLRIRTQQVGAGWLVLPSGHREAFLQRALVLRRDDGERAFVPDALIHRWIDPRAGVVAEVWGPASRDGKRRLVVEGAAVVDEVLRGATPVRVYVDSIDIPSETRLRYGYDLGEGTPVSSLTPDAHAVLSNLVAASSWDFSANNSSTEIASTRVDLDAAETCSFGTCGFTAGFRLNREDRDFEQADPLDQGRTMTIDEREDRAGDVTLWLRAGVNNDGQPQTPILDPTGGESRFCYVGTDDTGLVRTRVPLWRFSNDDGNGNFYAQNGDGWSHTPFNCEEDIFPHTCPNECVDNLLNRCPVRLAPWNALDGTQSTTVINEGPVTLPSGHTFDALLVESRVSMGIFDEDDEDCSNPLNQVNTFVYLWEVPNIGTVTRLATVPNVQDPSMVSTVELTDIKYGLFPPLSISVGAVSETTVELSWDPGAQNRVDAYRVYWDTDSGADSGYANDVTLDAALGTSTTVDGLDPGTQYYFTVTVISDYCDVIGCDPVSGMPTTRYESALYPLSAPGSPDPLPIEVTATTGGGSCVPTAEAAGVTVEAATGDEIRVCWDPATDPCLEGYQILGADTPESDAGFSVAVPDTGLVTCHDLATNDGYLLVVTRGSGGTGPWGHYGR